MGLQNVTMPAMASGYTTFSDTVGGVVVNARIGSQAGITALWARPYNDNYLAGDARKDSYFLDNVDVFGLMWPLVWDGYNITPWAFYCHLGQNAFRGGKDGADFALEGGEDMASMFPAGGARHRGFGDANGKNPGTGRAFWGGLTARITLHDPFVASFDLEAGSARWDSDARLYRHGWFASLLLEWLNDWGNPGVYAWYASGDDGNPANGSERLPGLSPTSGNYSFLAFDGAPYMARSSIVGNNMCGTQGVGARLENLSFFNNLSSSVRINYIRGTNAEAMARKMSLAGLWANSSALKPNAVGRAGDLGMPGLYMTERDQAFEIGATGKLKLAENFAICLEGAYIALWLDSGTSAWGARHARNQPIPQTLDAWNLNASFIYSF